MEHNLFKYVWRHSRPEQLVILFLVVIAMPFYFLSLDLPKQIVNSGIQGQGFSAEEPTQTYFEVYLPLGETITGAPIKLFGGFDFHQETLLIVLSFIFLTLVIINGLFKFTINTRKGRMGERLLRRLRYELSDRVLRFPLPHLRRMKQAEVATMIKDEVEPLGGFIGDAFVQPAFLGGQALTALAFIMVQSFWLGLISLAIVLIQTWLIPRLRRKLLILGKERQLAARALAGRIGEVMDGAVEMHVNDTSNWERADLVSRLGHIFKIRFEIYQRKFFIKFLNNLLSQMTPFIFYLVGGLLALAGELDIGALVAVIAAYKDLPGPIKELIDWDQQRLDVTIKYEQVIQQFEPGEIIEPESQGVTTEAVPALSGILQANGVTIVEDDGTRRLEGVSFSMPLDRHLAIVGGNTSGKERLATALAGLEPLTSGSLKLGEQDLPQLPEKVAGRRIAYVASDAYHFAGSVRDALLYGLRHAPYREVMDPVGEAERRFNDSEAKRAGNPVLPLNYDWVDRTPLGGEDESAERKALIAVLEAVELERDVFRFGLNGTIDPTHDEAAAKRLLDARKLFAQRLNEQDKGELVDHFDPDSYNRNANVAENLLFGTPTESGVTSLDLLHRAEVQTVLEESGLKKTLSWMGLEIARTMIELFADLPPDNPLFEQFSFISADDLEEFQAIVQRAERSGLDNIDEADQAMLLRPTYNYVEARHRLGLVDDTLEEQILEARGKIRKLREEGQLDGLEPFDPEAYSAAASILVNVLFGRVVYGQAEAETQVRNLVVSILDELDLRETVIAVGFNADVGIGGKRLTNAQRQQLAIARALLKQADLVVVNDAVGAMDVATQDRLLALVRKARAGKGLIWCMSRLEGAEGFDQVILLEEGRVTANGTFDEVKGDFSKKPEDNDD